MTHLDAAPAALPQQPDLRGLDTNTWPMWAIACLPLVSVLTRTLPAPIGGVHHDPTEAGSFSVSVSVSIVLVVAGVLLAVADRRILRQRGIIRPMHPAWEILDPAYVIGRTVVVRRRVGGSMAPLWVWIGTSVVAFTVNDLVR